MDRPFLTKTAILKRDGWTSTLITRLLGEPDQRKKVFGLSIPLALYAVERVELAERCQDFQQAQEAIAKRRMSAAKAVATKTATLMDAIRAMPIKVRTLSLDQVRALAIDSYNQRNEGRAFAHRSDDPAFLDRITVNFIRHELTQYDEALWALAGKTGKAQAVTAIRARIFSAIAEAYPTMCNECERQSAARAKQDAMADEIIRNTHSNDPQEFTPKP